MAEYINRERARFEAERYFKNMDEIKEDLDMLFCMLPAEDVEPVKRGRWLPQILNGTRIWDCSECKTIGSPVWKRCPVCEAKMDEEADHAQE